MRGGRERRDAEGSDVDVGAHYAPRWKHFEHGADCRLPSPTPSYPSIYQAQHLPISQSPYLGRSNYPSISLPRAIELSLSPYLGHLQSRSLPCTAFPLLFSLLPPSVFFPTLSSAVSLPLPTPLPSSRSLDRSLPPSLSIPLLMRRTISGDHLCGFASENRRNAMKKRGESNARVLAERPPADSCPNQAALSKDSGRDLPPPRDSDSEPGSGRFRGRVTFCNGQHRCCSSDVRVQRIAVEKARERRVAARNGERRWIRRVAMRILD